MPGDPWALAWERMKAKGSGGKTSDGVFGQLPPHPSLTSTEMATIREDICSDLGCGQGEASKIGAKALFNVDASANRFHEQTRRMDLAIVKGALAHHKNKHKTDQDIRSQLATIKVGTISDGGRQGPYCSLFACPGSSCISPTLEELQQAAQTGGEKGREAHVANFIIDVRRTVSWIWLTFLTETGTSLALLDDVLRGEVTQILTRWQPPEDGQDQYEMIGQAKNEGGLNHFEVLNRLRKEFTYAPQSTAKANLVHTRQRFSEGKPVEASYLSRWFDNILTVGSQLVKALGHRQFTIEALREEQICREIEQFDLTSPEYSEDDEEGREYSSVVEGGQDEDEVQEIPNSEGKPSSDESEDPGQLHSLQDYKNQIEQLESTVADLRKEVRLMAREASHQERKLAKANALLSEAGGLVKTWSNAFARHLFDVITTQLGRDERKFIRAVVFERLGYDIRESGGADKISFETLEMVSQHLKRLRSSDMPQLPRNSERNLFRHIIPRPPVPAVPDKGNPASNQGKANPKGNPKATPGGGHGPSKETSSIPKAGKSQAKGNHKVEEPAPAGKSKKKKANNMGTVLANIRNLDRDGLSPFQNAREDTSLPCQMCQALKTIGWAVLGDADQHHTGKQCNTLKDALNKRGIELPSRYKKERSDRKTQERDSKRHKKKD